MRLTPMRIAMAIALLPLTAGVASAQNPAADRMRLLRGDPSVKVLAEAIDHDDPLVARTAARLLPAKGTKARMPLGRALRHEDMLVRRSAAMNLGALGSEGVELVERALRDRDELVRQGAVYALMQMPKTAEVVELLERAREDGAQSVRNAALLATRSAYQTVGSIPLPAEGWRFRLDPDRVGRDECWFAADLDDSDWDEIAIEQAWQDAGYEYVGVAWYRRTIELPDRAPPARASLAFEGVDESAWVWVNGEFAGEHDVGPSGWNKPFRVDVTELLRWGRENQITVRAMNTAHAGGIWRPVSIVLLETRE
ncbi:MAG: HEAT repeat domain-containing protein [Armatimonadota bacterium]